MKSRHVAAAVTALSLGLGLGAAASDAGAAPLLLNIPPIIIRLPPPIFACKHYDKTACTTAELQNTWYKQVVILSAGYQSGDIDAFWSDFDTTINQMTGAGAGTTWSAQKKSQLLFVGYFTGGGALGTPTASFGATVALHPIRGYALTLRDDDVYSLMSGTIAPQHAGVRPFAAGVLFNTQQTPVTSSGTPPSLVRKPFGIAKMTAHDIASPYIPTHELAHAGLNYLDEYVDSGFEDLSITSFDVLTPLMQIDGTWGGFVAAIPNMFGVYDMRLSDILANNGNDNIATSRFPATVSTNGYSTPDYAYEGGFSLGRGVWHQPGSNLMNDDHVMRGADDGFAFAHSPSQQRVIDRAFSGFTARPNDRIRNAGPVSGWTPAEGTTTHVLLNDADKNHHFQPTQSYVVQVGWYERQWSTCWAAFTPYPCYSDVWTTAQKTVSPTPRSLTIRLDAAYALTTQLQELLCANGVDTMRLAGNAAPLCTTSLGTLSNVFAPTVTLDTPYTDVDVPASQWLTTYYWRFSTFNGSIPSGYTGWSSFYRSL